MGKNKKGQQNRQPQQQAANVPTQNNASNGSSSISMSPPDLHMADPQPIRAIQSVKTQLLDKRDVWVKEARKFPEQVDMDPARALRPDFVATDSKVEVLTNYFPIELNPQRNLMMYHVEGMPEKISSKKKRKLMEALIEKYKPFGENRSSIATDYKRKVITWKRLGDVELSTPPWQTPGKFVETVELESHDPRKATIGNTGAATSKLRLEIHFVRVVNVGKLVNLYSGKREGCDFVDNELLAAINIIIGNAIQAKSKGNAIEVGINRVFAKAGHDSLGCDNKTAIRGYSFGFRSGMGGALLNVSPITSTFHEPMTVSEYIAYGRKERMKELKGVRVYLKIDRANGRGMDNPELDTPQRRTKTISGFGTRTAGQQTYWDPNARRSYTIWEHMHWFYPGQSAGGPGSTIVNLGGSDRGHEQWFLAEDLMILPYQIYRGELTPQMTSSLIKKACRLPDQNVNAILSEFLPFLGMNNPSERGMRLDPLEMQISPKLLSVPAAPGRDVQIQYGNGTTPAVEGKWDLISQKFLSTDKSFGGKAVYFMLPQQSPNEKTVQESYMRFFFQECSRNGLAGLPAFQGFSASNNMAVTDYSVHTLSQQIQAVKRKGFGLVIMILPKKNKTNQTYYANFKAAADQAAGMVSLCLCDDKIKRCFYYAKQGQPKKWHELPQSVSSTDAFSGYARNIGMKLNLRLGNKNHSVESTELKKYIPGEDQAKNLMILGADVIHPGLDPVEGTPSISAVVGSLNASFAAFRGSARRQKPKDGKNSLEVIEAMKEMAAERIQAWKAANEGRLPTKILYYRDGIDEGQFASVQKEEVTAIRKAWESVSGTSSSSTKDLQITALVVTKRHNTRFYPKSNTNAIRNGNCRPGTTIDSGVTLPYYFDFYLISHNAIQGTARPAHYIVLQDEMGFTAKQIQSLTYLLCYTYARSTTSVSYVPAAYYADRLCERVKLYLRGVYEGEGEETVEGMWNRGKVGGGMLREGNPWHGDLDGTMFWM